MFGQQLIDSPAQRAWPADVLSTDQAQGAVVVAVGAAAPGTLSTPAAQALIVEQPIGLLTVTAAVSTPVRIDSALVAGTRVVASAALAAAGAASCAGVASDPLSVQARVGSGRLLAGRAGWGGQVGAGGAQRDHQPGQRERQPWLGESVGGEQLEEHPELVPLKGEDGEDAGDPRVVHQGLFGKDGRELMEQFGVLSIAADVLDAAPAARVAGLVAVVGPSQQTTPGARPLAGASGMAGAAEHALGEAQVRGFGSAAVQASRMDHRDLLGAGDYQGADEPVQHR